MSTAKERRQQRRKLEFQERLGMAPEQERYWCEAPPSPLLLLLPSPPSSSPALAAAASALTASATSSLQPRGGAGA